MKNEVMITVLFLVALVSCVYTTQVETVQVSPLTKKMLIVNLDLGEKFSGSLSISGGAGNDINFWVTNPNGNTILNLGRVSQGTTFEFTADDSGAYTFHFDNGFSLLSTKTVILSYDVTRPLELLIGPFVFIVIGIITVVAVGLIAWHYSRKKQTIPKETSLKPQNQLNQL